MICFYLIPIVDFPRVDSSLRISLVLDLVSVSTKSGDDDGWVWQKSSQLDSSLDFHV